MPSPVADVVAAALRRNGKKPSCEPCRKSKLSCDHIRPICGRCQRRRAPDRCVYHPAPMTNGLRPRLPSTGTNQSEREDNDPPQQPVASSLNQDLTTSLALREDGLTGASPPGSGFLGPTSYSAVFTEGQRNLSREDSKLTHEDSARGWLPSKLPSWDSNAVNEGAEILSLLANLSRHEQALKRCEVLCLSAVTLYIRECIALIPRDLKFGDGQLRSLAALSHKVFIKTSTPYSFDGSITLREYPSSLMGENLCWEVVGLMLTTLGLSAISMHEVNVYDESDSQTNWKELAHSLVRAGDQCITFCEQFGHLKDTGVTLILMNFILHTQVYGDAGKYGGAISASATAHTY